MTELRIEVLSRPGCGLCEEMIAELEFLLSVRKIDFHVTDIDNKPQLIEKYGLDIPVLFMNGREIARHRLDRDILEQELSKVDQ